MSTTGTLMPLERAYSQVRTLEVTH